MRRNFIITGLDVGTKTTKVLIAQKRPEESKLQVLGQGSAPSQGMRNGAVIDAKKAQESILASLEEAERAFGRKIGPVFVSAGGNRVFVTSSHGLVSVSRADRKISEEDIERVLQAAKTFPLPSNREILNVFPKEFAVDSESKIKEPLGMEGVRLEVEALILCGFSPHLEKLSEAVVGADLQVEELILTPLASARAVLSQRDKELGVALLDIGAGSTGLAVFEEGSLIHLVILPIGSTHITNDIAIGFECDIDTAEKAKIELGSSLLKRAKLPKGKKKREIEQGSGKILAFPQKKLVKVIEARASEILDLIAKELKKINRQGKLPAGVVLTGGGAKMAGIVELTKKSLKLPCRIGTPRDFNPVQEDPSLAAVAGLVLTGADLASTKQSKFSDFFRRIFRIFIP